MGLREDVSGSDEPCRLPPLLENAPFHCRSCLALENLQPSSVHPRRKRAIFSEDIWDTLHAPEFNDLVLHPRLRAEEGVELALVAHGFEHDDVYIDAVAHYPHPSQGC